MQVAKKVIGKIKKILFGNVYKYSHKRSENEILITNVTPAIPIKIIIDEIKNRTTKKMKNNLANDRNK